MSKKLQLQKIINKLDSIEEHIKQALEHIQCAIDENQETERSISVGANLELAKAYLKELIKT